jgi:DNA-binding IclR family transcriptional regulator
MAGNAAQPGATVTSRVLAILGSFDARHPLLRLADIARRSGLAMPTAHRLVGELAAWGALTRRDDGAYVIGRRLWQIGLLAPSSSTLREAAAPFLHDLHAATRATVHLGIREDLSVLYLERLAGSVSVPVISRVGSRLPLHATGVGKVLLAYAPAEIRAAALARLDRITPYTITQPRLLQRQLVRVLEEGYAQTQEEMSLGACSVAVPVRDHDQQVIAALGIVVPSLARHRARLVAALRVAAAGVERTLGPPP